jgi:putative hydrolase
MTADNRDGRPEDGSEDPTEEMQRMLRELLSGAGPAGLDPEQIARAAGLSGDSAAVQGLFATLQRAMQQSGEGIDWSIARRTAIDTVSAAPSASGDANDVLRAFPVASLWLDEATGMGSSSDAPRALSRIEWVQQTIDTWTAMAEPVANSISAALTEAMSSQLPEEMRSMLQGAETMLRNVGGALFAMQLGTIIGKLATEVVSAGDVGVPLFGGAGREGGALLPVNVAAFAAGLDQDAEQVRLALAVRELAHARLFRHAKWLRLHLISAITDYARGIRIDTERIGELAADLDPQHPEQIQELLSNGSLIPPKSPAQEAAHSRLETMLALIEGWVDVVTENATQRLPGATAIAEMVRRRRATGGPAEHAFSTLVGLELRPRRLREAAALWRELESRGGAEMRDSLWAHPDLLPTANEITEPALLFMRLGLNDDEATPADEFDLALAELLSDAPRPVEGLSGEIVGEPGADGDSEATDDDGPIDPVHP